MPVVRRRLFTLCAALSLLLCVAVGVLWVRSYWVADVVSVAGGPPPPAFSSEWYVRSNTGFLCFARNDNSSFGFDTRPLGWTSHSPFPDFNRPVAQLRKPSFVLGPLSVGGTASPTMRHAAVKFPHWLPAALTAAAPLLWLRRYGRDRRRVTLGLCPTCGYDLRASPTRCPECGAANSGGNSN